jgi:hypothetical protein
MGLKEDGFRFVYQDGLFDWLHPSEISRYAVDCTDMTEDEFVEFVKQITNLEENAE